MRLLGVLGFLLIVTLVVLLWFCFVGYFTCLGWLPVLWVVLGFGIRDVWVCARLVFASTLGVCGLWVLRFFGWLVAATLFVCRLNCRTIVFCGFAFWVWDLVCLYGWGGLLCLLVGFDFHEGLCLDCWSVVVVFVRGRLYKCFG